MLVIPAYKVTSTDKQKYFYYELADETLTSYLFNMLILFNLIIIYKWNAEILLKQVERL